MGISNNPEYDKLITGSFTAVSQTLDITTANTGTTTIQVTGTWVGTIIVEVSNDNSTWVQKYVINAATNAQVVAINANGAYTSNTNAFANVRLSTSAWTSGTATVSVFGSDATSAINVSIDQGMLVPTITNKMRVRYVVGNVTVPAAYTTIYTRSGTGLFFGFQVDFNSANVRLKLTIDGGQIFELTVADLKLFQFNDTTTTRNQMGGWWSTVGNTVDFSSRYAIPYTSSVLLEMQRSDGTNHTMSQYMVFLTEDT